MPSSNSVWYPTSAFYTDSTLVAVFLPLPKYFGYKDTYRTTARSDGTTHETLKISFAISWLALDSQLRNRYSYPCNRTSPAVFLTFWKNLSIWRPREGIAKKLLSSSEVQILRAGSTLNAQLAWTAEVLQYPAQIILTCASWTFCGAVLKPHDNALAMVTISSFTTDDNCLIFPLFSF